MTKDVIVSQTVRVTVNKRKFTQTFMAEFRRSFYEFHTLDQHLKHLAQLHSRGIAGHELNPDPFIEGYGSASEFGIKFEVVDTDTEIQ